MKTPRHLALIAGAFLSLLIGPALATAPELLFVGVMIHRQEAGALEVRRHDEGFLIPLEDFAEMAGCRIEREGEAIVLATPMGRVELTTSETREIDGVVYIAEAAIENKLATPVDFDSALFALRLALPWNPAEIVDRRAVDRLVPDVTAPSAGLSTVRGEMRYARDRGASDFDSSLRLDGRVLGGRWLLSLEDSFSDQQELREYAWLKAHRNQLWLAGQQRIRLHPLVRNFEMTGVQFAWTNQPVELFSRSTEPGELLPRRVQPLSSFRGHGPPAGVAELRLDETAVARRTIALDGTYEFLDVVLPARQLNRIEVWIYDRRNLAVPVEIQEKSESTSELLLKKGAKLHLSGAGRAGNLFQDRIDTDYLDADDAVGFYQWRQGLTRNLTVEAAAQHTADGTQALAGFVARLGRGSVMSWSAGVSDGKPGYDLVLDSRSERWRLLGRSQWMSAGFEPDIEGELFDHFAVLGYQPSRRLDLSLVGRSRRTSTEHFDFLLPALTWRAARSTALRVRPDSEGDYRVYLDHSFSRDLRLGVSVQDRTAADLSWRLGSYQLALGAEVGDSLGERYDATASWYGSGPRRPNWNVGVLAAEGNVGFRLAASLAVLPGVLARLEWIDDPLSSFNGGRRDRRFVIGLRADLAFARGRLLPASSRSRQEHRGAIAGRVVVDGELESGRHDLVGLTILLDGRPITRTGAGGTFFLGHLKEGVHRLELDPDGLPIELTPEKLVILTEVVASAVTRADFRVRPEYGVAGRVRDGAGRNVTGVVVEVLDADGVRVASAVTDRFGLYRLDGLPTGVYTLRVVSEDRSAARTVEIVDDFLFDQDLGFED